MEGTLVVKPRLSYSVSVYIEIIVTVVLNSCVLSCRALSGSMTGGFVFQRCNQLIILAIATFGQGLATLFTPLCASLYSMMSVKFVAFFFGGMLDAGRSQ